MGAALPGVLSPIGEAQQWAIGLVLVAVALDVVAGVCEAAKAHELSSSKAREGLWHKAGEVLVVALAVLIEVGSAHLDLGFDVPLVVPVCVYLVLNETMSILENVGEMNPELKSSKLLSLFKSSESSDEREA